MKSLHGELRTRRLLVGLSLANAGALVGLSESMMSLLERQKRKLRPDVYARLLEVYATRKGRDYANRKSRL